ncbi:ATP-binding protein [Corynebacterium kutscheri]|uniref:ATP-binding protein n=1 Tax=Corynebacterium kutscheri TaxID=35755 RepID=A0AB38VPP7_9CORY|nr:hypothetical protein [Corynebacterium kutscheri]VEH04448.1 ATP-binding protein [Corynebacterium kutscheri]VEH10228.1 ATP-binding protein [Corynebacterium kutscheri]VEH80310.1 ATP-binding protein [Corynebacterium kutscheri]
MQQYRIVERNKGVHNEHSAAQVLEFAQVQPMLRVAGSDSLGKRSVRAGIREQFFAQQQTQKTGEMVMGLLATIIMIVALLLMH